MKELKVRINKFKLADCTNGGASSRYDEMILLWDESKEQSVYENYIKENQLNPDQILFPVARFLFGSSWYWHVEPWTRGAGIGPMASGNHIVIDSDSGLPFEGKVKIHDRWESQELYNILSRD